MAIIAKNLKDISEIILAKGTLHSFKGEFALYYQFTYKKLIKQLLEGKILHADETQAKLVKKDGYVWVFTNMEIAILLFKSSREGDFLKQFLKDFHGILISDFYSAYDSLECQQQKCLVHLIRDLNQDLFKNPFDEEFKILVENFGILLRKIIDTIDKYGLKKRNLNKHKKDVKKYYIFLKRLKHRSELTQKYKKRFEKNKDKLFTFLDYTGVPWNNNNAENAIKHFALYRRIADGYFTESSLTDYLLLLSIYQTCKYKNINFFQFLLSGKKTID